mmetsp:Transcript_4554/g.8385  ORF Transcript_4554/g.8385 Transcript_4554/m.8385 type:complete len:82 (+) Transcript_4554:232-477(+)
MTPRLTSMPYPCLLCECFLHCIKTTSFGKIDSIVNDNRLMASKGDLSTVEFEGNCRGHMNQPWFLVHFAVRARSFLKIKTF